MYHILNPVWLICHCLAIQASYAVFTLPDTASVTATLDNGILVTADAAVCAGTAAIAACYMYDKDSSNCLLKKYPVTAVYVCVASNRIPLG